MKPKERRRLAAVEEELYDAQVELEELRVKLWLMLHSDDPRRTARVLLAVEEGQASVSNEADDAPELTRPALRAIEGSGAVDADSIRATAAADQSPGWAAHSDRVAGRARRMPRRDRHGLHAL